MLTIAASSLAYPVYFLWLGKQICRCVKFAYSLTLEWPRKTRRDKNRPYDNDM